MGISEKIKRLFARDGKHDAKDKKGEFTRQEIKEADERYGNGGGGDGDDRR